LRMCCCSRTATNAFASRSHRCHLSGVTTMTHGAQSMDSIACAAMNPDDPIERFHRLTQRAPALKLLIALVVAALTGLAIGAGAMLVGLSTADVWWVGGMAAIGALPAVFVNLR